MFLRRQSWDHNEGCMESMKAMTAMLIIILIIIFQRGEKTKRKVKEDSLTMKRGLY